MSVYSTDEWRRRRRAYLRTHPTCECGCGQPATEVDHVPPRELLLAMGIHDPDADQWLHAMTKPCHSRATRLRDMPLLARWRAGEPPELLAEEAMAWSLTR